MSYTDDGVLAKLSALNETQESIVTVAQWVMFHKRHAERTVQLWLQRLKDSGANKRLNLIYLANEVAQQSKARRKTEFLVAFSPIITEATAVAYRGATNEVQQKLKRVIEVWRQRQIFEEPIQIAIEARVEELNRLRMAGKKPLLGPSHLSGSSNATPVEMQPLVPLQSTVSRLAPHKASLVASANMEYVKLTDPQTQAPAPPVHAARLSGLLKSLASAEGAVAESIKARRALIEGLEKTLEMNRIGLRTEETEASDLADRKTTIEAKKREVEDGIMRGLADDAPASNHPNGSFTGLDYSSQDLTDTSGHKEPQAPAVEALSPPALEAFSPAGTPPPEDADLLLLSTIVADTDVAAATSSEAHVNQEAVLSDHSEPAADAFLASLPPPGVGLGADLLSSLAMPAQTTSPALNITTTDPPTPTPPPAAATTTTTTTTTTITATSSSSPFSLNGSSAKKRKITAVAEKDEFVGFGDGDGDAMDGIDADVAEMLRKDSAQLS